MKIFPNLGVQIPKVYLPKPGVDLQKWAVIACDQFTSQPDYWQAVEQYVGDSPSTLHLILPEAYLGTDVEINRISSSQAWMKDYLQNGVLQSTDEIIYVERTVGEKTRRGVMLALDLEKYDFSIDSQSLIRASEGTILDRLPPRIRIREGAALELPHILVLIDDPNDLVIGPIESHKADLPVIYDFNLMKESGHLRGRAIDDHQLESGLIRGLQELASPINFSTKYGVSPEKGFLLFAVGDGNHSLATAKSIWEKLKPSVGMDHPARYALVEIENIHDPGLQFEPIHRVLFNVKGDVQSAFLRNFGVQIRFEKAESEAGMIRAVASQPIGQHRFGLISSTDLRVGIIDNPTANLAVGSLQPVLDQWLGSGEIGSIDYVHGEEAVLSLGAMPGNVGIYLPAMHKRELFRTILLDGTLPRKTFSMGEAHEKRFYMESRKITL